MKVLLFSMPNVGPRFPPHVWSPPNLGLASLAANAPDHDVICADLLVRRKDVPGAVREAMAKTSPRLVGLTSMSFQYHTVLRIADLVREIDPTVPIILGGYHATLLYEELTASERGSRTFDYMMRGEGETAFRMLLAALESGGDLATVPSLSWKKDGAWVHNERGPLEDLATIRIPKRSARLWQGEYFTRAAQRKRFLKVLLTNGARQPLDFVETSRGCTMPCTFCSMRHMYGRTFRTYDIDRVMDDIADSKTYGTEWIAFADDNITLDVPRFERLCDAIVAAGHNDVSYMVQTSAAGVASSARLAKKMSRANIRIAFLGIENVSDRNLAHLKKGNILDQARTAIRYLHENDILIVGGIILGNPDDTVTDVIQNYDFLEKEKIEFFGDQIAQPYPKTEMREELLRQGLVTRPYDYRRYDGFWANVRSKHLTSDQLQFLMWKHHKRGTYYDRTPTFRRAYPIYTIIRRLIAKPIKRFLKRLRDWNRTEAEAFRAQMHRHAQLNNFWDDEPPEDPFAPPSPPPTQ